MRILRYTAGMAKHTTILLAMAVVTAAGPAFAEDLARPDPAMTPGAVDPAVTLARICTESTRHRRSPSTKLCDQVFAAYSIPPADRYQ